MSVAKLNLDMLNYFKYQGKRKMCFKNDDETGSITQSDLQSMDVCESYDSSPISSSRTSETDCRSQIPLGLESNLPLKVQCYIPNPSPRKRVTFAKTVRVVLIPCRRELQLLRYYLWWTVIEIDSFKAHAFFEMQQFVRINQCSIKDGLVYLYQPEIESPQRLKEMEEQRLTLEKSNETFKCLPFSA